MSLIVTDILMRVIREYLYSMCDCLVSLTL